MSFVIHILAGIIPGQDVGRHGRWWIPQEYRQCYSDHQSQVQFKMTPEHFPKIMLVT